MALSKEVIDANRNRILSRLRSKHAKTSRPTKAPLADRLRVMTDALSALDHCDTEITALRSTVSKLVRDLTQLEATPNALVKSGKSDEKLLAILSRLEDLPETSRLRAILDQIPADKFSHPDSLVLAIVKLRNYRGSCQLLASAVRSFTFFQSVSVETVDAKTTVPLKELQGTASIREVLRRLDIQWDNDCTRKLNMNLQKIDAQFRREMTALRPKVHAEVQLVYHYELHAQLERPRVIGSSKSACYLCDTFVKLHSKFFISKTHGVLYPQWTLPDMSPGSLSPAREQAIRSSVRNLITGVEDLLRDTWTRAQANRVQPNESAISLLHWTPLSSTSVSATLDQAASRTRQALSLTQMCISNSKNTLEANKVPIKALTVNEELLPPEESASLSGADPVGTSLTSHDLDCSDDAHMSANIGDHGSRSCVAHAECRRPGTAEMGDLASADLSHSACAKRKIDFHDIGIHMTLEFPKDAIISITTGEQSERMEGMVGVDLGLLSPGCEINLDIDDDNAQEGRSIVLMHKTHSEKILWWKIVWH